MAPTTLDDLRAYLGTFTDTASSLEEIRAALDSNPAMAALPKGVRVRRSVLGGRPVEWLEPDPLTIGPGGGTTVGDDDDVPGAAILYLHGGGFCTGSFESHRNLCGRLALAAGIPVAVLDYRRSPEHRFPIPLDDAVAAYRDLLRSGLPPSRLAIVGDSAGGNLALGALVTLRDAGDPLPAAGALLSPWIDLTQTAASFDTCAATDPLNTRASFQFLASVYLDGADPTSPTASPVLADLAGLPPLRVDVADNEVLRDDSVRLAERGEACGIEVTLRRWPDLVHVFQAFPAAIVPESETSLVEIGAFLARAVRWTT